MTTETKNPKTNVAEAPSVKTSEEKILRQMTPHDFDPSKPHIYVGISKFDMAIKHPAIDVVAKNLFEVANGLSPEDDFVNFKRKLSDLSHKSETMLTLFNKSHKDPSTFLVQIEKDTSILYDALKSLKWQIDFAKSLETKSEFNSHLVSEYTGKLIPLLKGFQATYDQHSLLHSEKAFKIKVFGRWNTYGVMVARESLYIDFSFQEDIKFLGEEQDIEYATYFDILLPLVNEATKGAFNETNIVFVIGFWNAIEPLQNDYKDRDLGIVIFNGSNPRGVIREMTEHRFKKDAAYKEITENFELPGESKHVHAFTEAHKKLNKQLKATA